ITALGERRAERYVADWTPETWSADRSGGPRSSARALAKRAQSQLSALAKRAPNHSVADADREPLHRGGAELELRALVGRRAHDAARVVGGAGALGRDPEEPAIHLAVGVLVVEGGDGVLTGREALEDAMRAAAH